MILDLVPALLIYVLICLMQKNLTETCYLRRRSVLFNITSCFLSPSAKHAESRQCRVELVDPSDLLRCESSCCVNM